MRENTVYDAFVCCILSHGNTGNIFTTDEETIPILEIADHFSDTRCPSLKGKPKVFFIQSCQNDARRSESNERATAIEEIEEIAIEQLRKLLNTFPTLGIWSNILNQTNKSTRERHNLKLLTTFPIPRVLLSKPNILNQTKERHQKLKLLITFLKLSVLSMVSQSYSSTSIKLTSKLLNGKSQQICLFQAHQTS